MKQGWTYKKLGEVCEVISGQSPDGKYYNSEGKGTPFYQGKKDFTSKSIGNPTVWTTEETKIAEKDDLLMSVRAPVGDVNFATQRSCIGRGLAAIRSKDNLNKEYLFYFLLAIKDKIKGKEGVGFASINRKEIMDIDLKYPISLSEQQRIVERLDSAFAHIDELKANAEKQVNEARALFQKALSKAMEPKEGWEEKTLKETAKYRRGSFPQPYGNKEWYDGEGSMPFVQVAELQDDSFNMIPVTKRRISKIAQPLSVFVPAGTVLVSLQGSIGKVAITNYDSYVDRTIAIFQDYKFNIDKRFFAFQLKKRFEIERLKARGTTIKTITKEEFANFIIYYPPLAEQQRIVERLDSFSKNVKALEENQQKVIAECDALKQALLRKVFN